MAFENVLVNLFGRGITPAVRKVGGKTILKYSLGEKHLVQLFDEAGKLSKYKLYQNDGLLGGKTITKGTKICDTWGGFPTNITTKVKKDIYLPNCTEKTEIISSEIIPGEKSIQITKTRGIYDPETISISSSKNFDGGYTGIIEKKGGIDAGVRQFNTNKNLFGLHEDSFASQNVFGNPLNLDTFGQPNLSFLNQIEEQQNRLLSQQNDDIILGSLWGSLNGLI